MTHRKWSRVGMAPSLVPRLLIRWWESEKEGWRERERGRMCVDVRGEFGHALN